LTTGFVASEPAVIAELKRWTEKVSDGVSSQCFEGASSRPPWHDVLYRGIAAVEIYWTSAYARWQTPLFFRHAEPDGKGG
jgi:hypothetical protein